MHVFSMRARTFLCFVFACDRCVWCLILFSLNHSLTFFTCLFLLQPQWDEEWTRRLRAAEEHTLTTAQLKNTDVIEICDYLILYLNICACVCVPVFWLISFFLVSFSNWVLSFERVFFVSPCFSTYYILQLEHTSITIFYKDEREFSQIAYELKLMPDLKVAALLKPPLKSV